MEEDDVKSTCRGTRLEFRIEKYGKNINLKSYTLLKSVLKIWQDETNLLQSPTRCIFFNSKSDT